MSLPECAIWQHKIKNFHLTTTVFQHCKHFFSFYLLANGQVLILYITLFKHFLVLSLESDQAGLLWIGKAIQTFLTSLVWFLLYIDLVFKSQWMGYPGEKKCDWYYGLKSGHWTMYIVVCRAGLWYIWQKMY